MSGHDFGPLHLACLEEACRATDVIDTLTGLLKGGQLVELIRNESESSDSVVEVRVVVNGLYAERRQQQEVFRRMTGELRLAGKTAAVPGANSTPAGKASPASVAEGEEGGSGGVADLTAWIDAARRAASED